MKVTFIGLKTSDTNRFSNLSLQKYLHANEKPEERFTMTLDKIYVVYGLAYSKDGHILFLLINDNKSYPDFYPSEFFEVVDDRVSKYWVGYPQSTYSKSCVFLDRVISFDEAAHRPFFFDDLLNDVKAATQTFKIMKEKIDIEFPDAILKTASILERNWIVCAYCEEAWESSPENGVVTCPQKHANNNPLWRP